MNTLTRMEQIQLLSFIKTMINKPMTDNLKKEISNIYFKLEKEFNQNEK